jgi:hypothetical protein
MHAGSWHEITTISAGICPAFRLAKHERLSIILQTTKPRPKREAPACAGTEPWVKKGHARLYGCVASWSFPSSTHAHSFPSSTQAHSLVSACPVAVIFMTRICNDIHSHYTLWASIRSNYQGPLRSHSTPVAHPKHSGAQEYQGHQVYSLL